LEGGCTEKAHIPEICDLAVQPTLQLRPLGLPAWSDKLVGEVVRLLLEAIYEPVFRESSHGFRAGHGCHTALRDIRDRWTGTVWFIEADITDCFTSIDHEILLGILAERISDQRFLRLMRNMLNAGYLEDWEYRESLSGVPQGGVISPILSNVYLHKLDEFVEQELIPSCTRGTRRRSLPEYRRVLRKIESAKKQGDRKAYRSLRKELRKFPSRDPTDPGYRRLQYARYADDELLGFIGPKAEAEEIREKLACFLRDTLGLELNQQKTLITHAGTHPARYLGYDIRVQHSDTKCTGGSRVANGKVALRVPPDVVKAQCTRYRNHGKPWHRSRLQNLDDYTIVQTYGAEFRGVVNYYLLAQNVSRLNTLQWYAETSLLETLAAKHKSSVSKMAARYKAKAITVDGPRKCLEARRKREGKPDLIARFGGITLRQGRRAVIRDPATVRIHVPRKELVHRLRKKWCELCETGGTVAVHQVTGLSALGKPGPGQPAWAALMAKKQRKTLIVCGNCHEYIHANPVTHAA
jgi:group II intron reverse transcriptase/maturase